MSKPFPGRVPRPPLRTGAKPPRPARPEALPRAVAPSALTRPDATPRLPARPAPRPAAATAWEPQAAWYDQHQGDGGDDFYQQVLMPVILRRLGAREGERVLDVCCGQGVLGRALAASGVRSLGIDASPSLIAAARARADRHQAYVVGDARALAKAVSDRSFDHAALIMAVQDVDRLADLLAGIATLVKPGARLVIALTHPCFRVPKRSSWSFDEAAQVQYRRLDGYLSPEALAIRTHPGQVADASTTRSFHRPLSTYLEALGIAGFGVTGCDELCSHRRGTRGPRYAAEDRAAREFPLFLVLTAVRLPAGVRGPTSGVRSSSAVRRPEPASSTPDVAKPVPDARAPG